MPIQFTKQQMRAGVPAMMEVIDQLPENESVLLDAERVKMLLFACGAGALLWFTFKIDPKTDQEYFMKFVGTPFFFFFLCLAVAATLPGSNKLELSHSGIILTRFFKVRAYKWSDFSSIFVGQMASAGRPQSIVALNFANRDVMPKHADWSRSMHGFEYSIGHTFGLSREDLAGLLESCRRKYGKPPVLLPNYPPPEGAEPSK